jgi:hypothetical protein
VGADHNKLSKFKGVIQSNHQSQNFVVTGTPALLMTIPVVEFSREVYKIRKVFG